MKENNIIEMIMKNNNFAYPNEKIDLSSIGINLLYL